VYALAVLVNIRSSMEHTFMINYANMKRIKKVVNNVMLIYK